jgi:hypothetical protein
LIQFVEHQSFVDPGDDENWCHLEYVCFDKSRTTLKSHDADGALANYFVISPPVVKETAELFPAKPLDGYEAWLKEITEIKAMRLRKQQISQDVLREDFRPLVEQVGKLRTSFMDKILYN